MNKIKKGKCLVVIINWQQCQLTKNLLETASLMPEFFDILIFDNESTKKSHDFFVTNNHLFSYYHSSAENLGFDIPCNFGLNLAYQKNYDFIFFLNNDATITNNDAVQLLTAVQKNHNIALASPLIKEQNSQEISFSGAKFNQNKTIIEHIALDEIPNDLNAHQYLLYGTALLGRVLPLIEAGGFYEPFFAYWEDFLLCDKLISLGYACSIVKSSSVFHTNDRSNETNTPRSQYYYYYLTRNEIVFWKKVSSSTSFKPIYWLIRRSASTVFTLIKQSNYSQSKAIILGLSDGILGHLGKWKHHLKKNQ